MKYAKLKVLADNLSEPEMKASLASLVTDPRFAAVVRLITQQKELSADASSALQFANNPGCLAHAAGVRYGMLELEGQLKQLCEPPKQRGAQPPKREA